MRKGIYHTLSACSFLTEAPLLFFFLLKIESRCLTLACSVLVLSSLGYWVIQLIMSTNILSGLLCWAAPYTVGIEQWEGHGPWYRVGPQLMECGMFEGCMRAVNKVIGKYRRGSISLAWGSQGIFQGMWHRGWTWRFVCDVAMAGLAVGGREHLWRGNSQSRGAEWEDGCGFRMSEVPCDWGRGIRPMQGTMVRGGPWGTDRPGCWDLILLVQQGASVWF